jgi:hypothetical protein
MRIVLVDRIEDAGDDHFDSDGRQDDGHDPRDHANHRSAENVRNGLGEPQAKGNERAHEKERREKGHDLGGVVKLVGENNCGGDGAGIATTLNPDLVDKIRLAGLFYLIIIVAGLARSLDFAVP